MQQVLVAVIVVAAVLFAAWRLMGGAARIKLVSRAVQWAPPESGIARLLQRTLQQQRVALLGAGCGQCSKAKSD